MKTPMLVALVMVLTLAASVHAQEPAKPPAAVDAEGTPGAVFEKTEIDAGDVMRGTDLPFSFVVQNSGDAVLKILSAKPG